MDLCNHIYNLYDTKPRATAFGETAVVGVGENVSEGNDTVLGHTT